MDRPPVDMEYSRFFQIYGAVETIDDPDHWYDEPEEHWEYYLEYTVYTEYYVEYVEPEYAEPEIHWEYHQEYVEYHLQYDESEEEPHYFQADFFQYLDEWHYLAPETGAEDGGPAAAGSTDGDEEEEGVEDPDQINITHGDEEEEVEDPDQIDITNGNQEVPDQRRSSRRTILSRLRALFSCCCATEEE